MKRLTLLRSLLTAITVSLIATVPLFAQKTTEPTNEEVTKHDIASGKTMHLNGIDQSLLPNGLTVLTKEVHTAPVVYFSIYYRVGSVNEEVGQTGMSHLMEHMMFKGTKKMSPGVISSLLQRNGADFNASTSFDRTEYHETLASDRLELAMQIESDRMVNSLFDEKQHQKEMTVVRSEYEAGENNPERALSKAVRLGAYQIHPYRWETIGFRSDIENFTRDEMLAYYKNYYTPNNAVIVLVGDFDTKNAMGLINKYFGKIPARPVEEHFITPEPAQEGERRVIVRRAGTANITEIVYHIPGFGDKDRYAIDILEMALAGGRTSRFFQHLIQTGIAEDANAYDYGLHYPDLMTFQAVAQPGHTNEELEKSIMTELEVLKTTPLSDEEMQRAVNQAEAGYIFGKESVTEQGDRLGEDAMRGDWRYGETYLENIRKVTKEDIMRVAQKYITDKNKTVGYFIPSGPPAPGASMPGSDGALHALPIRKDAQDLLTPTTRNSASSNLITYRDYHSGSASVRKLIPSTSGQTKPVKYVLDNGISLVVQENKATPTISLSGALLTAGSIYEAQNEKGLAGFTASLTSRGAGSKSLMDIARILEGMGASVGISGGQEYATVGIHSLSKDFEKSLSILAEELRNPTFPEAEIEKARAQALADVENARDDTGTLAEITFNDSIYKPGHPYYSPTLDEQAAFLKSVKRDDLVRFHNEHYTPNKLILTVVGDIEPEKALSLVKQYLGDWHGDPNIKTIDIPNVPKATGPIKTVFIPVADKAQTDVRLGFPGDINRKNPDFYAMIVLDTILGGGTGLASRLATDVRDKMGLVYGIYADNVAGLGAGPFQVEFGSNPANVDKAVDESQRQLQLIHDKGVTKQEVDDAVSYITGSYAVTLSTNGAVARQLLVSQLFDLGLDYIQKRNGYYKAVTVDQVNKIAKQHLTPESGVLVICGSYSGKYAKTTK